MRSSYCTKIKVQENGCVSQDFKSIEKLGPVLLTGIQGKSCFRGSTPPTVAACVFICQCVELELKWNLALKFAAPFRAKVWKVVEDSFIEGRLLV